VIAVAVFTAGITTALTKRELKGAVQSLADLRQVRVGAVAKSAGANISIVREFRIAAFPVPMAG
jgi:hypothetical protein